MESRDKRVLERIVMFCDRIAGNLDRYHSSREEFERDTLFQDACCMCVVQIGELAAQLSETVRGKIRRSRGGSSKTPEIFMCIPTVPSIRIPSGLR